MSIYFTLVEWEHDRARWRALYGHRSLRQVLAINAKRFRAARYPVSSYVETDGELASIVAAVRALPVVDRLRPVVSVRRVFDVHVRALRCPRAAGSGCVPVMIQAIGLHHFVCPAKLAGLELPGARDGLTLSGIECVVASGVSP